MDDEQKVVALYQQNKKLREIAKEVFGVQSIQRVLTVLRNHPESGYVEGRRRTRRNKYFYREDFFEKIDTEAKAYFLGFFTADGWIKYTNGNPVAVAIEINTDDREVLEQFRQAIGEGAPPIVDRISRGKATTRLIFFSAKMARDLIALGMPHDKTNELGDITGVVPHELMRHFVRGYSDGDGGPTVSRYRLRWNFRGTMEFLKGLQRVIPHETRITIGTQKWPSLRSDKHRVACRIWYWMYEDATIFLKRKKIKSYSAFARRRA